MKNLLLLFLAFSAVFGMTSCESGPDSNVELSGIDFNLNKGITFHTGSSDFNARFHLKATTAFDGMTVELYREDSRRDTDVKSISIHPGKDAEFNQGQSLRALGLGKYDKTNIKNMFIPSIFEESEFNFDLNQLIRENAVARREEKTYYNIDIKVRDRAGFEKTYEVPVTVLP
ncbi:hypothetical protein [Persicobacter psychrovividus]|uniref:Uncharacterized protein n=1 Tax=Persicobacter psychrovividus TaxID=387638 RepID=A0ABN6LDU1_9BACT|nr:hypothetical protein PEPS_18440 [Persicobacter psychrovividus]